MRYFIITILAMFISAEAYAGAKATSTSAPAADFSIAAVVNDAVITRKDLEERIKIISNNGNISPSQRKNIADSVLQSLIEEKLKLQEAKRLNISISEEDIKRVIADVENRNKIPPGSFDLFLQQNNFAKESVLEQIKAQIAWNKIVGQRIRPGISLTDSEIADGLSMAKLKPKKPKEPEIEYKIDEEKSSVNLAQVILPREKNVSEKEMLLRLADVASNTTSCADVENLRKKNNKLNFIRMGDLRISYLEPNIRKLVVNLPAGRPSQLLKGPQGVTFFILCERNDKKIALPPKKPVEEKPEELTKDKVAEILGSQKMDLEARRYLKRLREEAFIEIR